MSHPESPHPNPGNESSAAELRTTVSEVAESIYHSIANRFETDVSTVHRSQFCGYVEPVLRGALAERGVEVAERVVHFPSGGVHRFVQTPDGRLWDPTWQQFLPADKLSPDLPKVLGGTPEEVQEYLNQIGMQEQIGAIWSGQEEVQLPERDDDEGWGWQGSEERVEGLAQPDVVVNDEMIEAIKRMRDTM
jgi:hypothetical protein